MEYDTLMPKNTTRFTWVDSLKGIAICAVVWVHSGGGNIGNILDPLGKAGAYWVQMFLILTVYLSYRSLRMRFERNQNNRVKSSIQWFLERIWKITPLYYFILALFLMVIPPGANIWLGTATDRPDAMNIIMHLLYLHGFFPYYCNSIMWVEWYLGVMVIYLCLIPVLCRNIRKGETAGIGAVILIAISIVATSILSCLNPLNDEYIWTGWVHTYSFIIHLPALALGISLFYLEKKKIGKKHLNLMFGSSIIGYIILSYLTEYYAESSLIQNIKIAGFSLIFFLLILSKKASDNTILNNRIWQLIGRNSYAIYLLHFLLIYVGGIFISDDQALRMFHSSLIWQIIKFISIMPICLFFSVVWEKVIGDRIYIWGKRKISGYF